MTVEGVISHCKSIISRHGIPEVVIADNRYQFGANVLRRFSREFQFEHIPQARPILGVMEKQNEL